MEIIENFAALSFEEQKKFAADLVEKINKESSLSTIINFKITEVKADDLTGNLAIEVIPEDETLEVDRKATWYAADHHDMDPDSSEVEYVDLLKNDVKKMFKDAADVDGYKITLEVTDIDSVDTVGFEVDDYAEEDSGIGSYEYWGTSGYDSNPYVSVEGTITEECYVWLSLTVEPN